LCQFVRFCERWNGCKSCKKIEDFTLFLLVFYSFAWFARSSARFAFNYLHIYMSRFYIFRHKGSVLSVLLSAWWLAVAVSCSVSFIYRLFTCRWFQFFYFVRLLACLVRFYSRGWGWSMGYGHFLWMAHSLRWHIYSSPLPFSSFPSLYF
jgi:hypothetical protein